MGASFGTRVRAARIERGLTQVELAVAVQRAPSHISNIENGYIRASAEDAARIEQFLQMSFSAPPRSEPQLCR